MAKKSQKQLVLEALLKGDMITPMDALNKFGCFRLGSIINRLRERYDIITRIPKGKSYAQYYLVMDGVRRIF